MNRRSRWIVLGLLLAVALALGVLFWVLSRRHRSPSEQASRAHASASTSDRERIARVRAVRERLRDQLWGPNVPRLLQGQVTSTQGPPVPGAMVRVMLTDGRVRLTETLPDGRYALAGIPATARRMEVSAKGYETRVFSPFHLPAAPSVRWDVKLVPAEGLFGIVLAEDTDKPVVGAGVRLSRKYRQYPPEHRTTTDLGGRFALPWPKGGGPQWLWVNHGAYGQVLVRVQAPGEITVRMPAGGRVSGRVVDDRGRPVTRFRITAALRAYMKGAPLYWSVEDDQGRFDLKQVPRGRQRLYVYADGYQPGVSAPISVRAGKHVRGVVIRLKSSGELYGRVTDASTGQPIQGAVVNQNHAINRRLGDALGAATDDGGNYVMRSLPGSRSTLWVRAPGYETLMAGGIECPPGKRVRRDFALTAVPPGEKPRGQITGIGAVLRRGRSGVEVVKLMDNGPAAEFLKPGDTIVMVDGAPVGGRGLNRIVQSIRGETGTDVELWIRRGGGPPQRVVITRDTVSFPRRGK